MPLPVTPSRLTLALMALGWACAAGAASLGELQLGSALGERFDGRIVVNADPDEELSTRCFRLVASDNDGPQLLRARLLYEDGQLYIRSDETMDEPLLQLTVRLSCPGREGSDFQREYMVLLDPRDYTAPVTLPRTAAGSRTRPATQQRRALPPLGGVLRSEAGDSIEQIARRYYPQDAQERAWLIDEIHLLNPDLPQNSRARLESGLAIYLPEPRLRPQAPPAGQLLPPPAPAGSGFRIEPLPTAAPLPEAPQRQVAGDGDFRLRLSGPDLDLQHQGNLTPEESLRLRENLLLLESDDQTAQLMQLKYQIAQLEKQLAQLKSRPAAAETGPARDESSGIGGWVWGGLLLLVLLPTGYAYWRWRERRIAEEVEAFSLATNLEPRFGTTVLRPSTGLGEMTASPQPQSAGMRDLAHNIAQMANEWHNDEVDVVLPGNVSEEAQLLIDHGLVQQAVNLLSHEIEQHPTTLALWMKLFDVLRQNEMVQQFQERAVAFRLQFASDALWQQVQAQGRELDPGNPLYEAVDEIEPPAPRVPELKPSGISSLNAVTVAGPPSVLEFSLEPMESEAAPETSERIEIDIEAGDDAPPMLPEDALEEVEAVAVEEPRPIADNGEGEPLFSPEDFMVATEVNQSGMEQAQVDPAEFVTDDPVLRQVADMLARGENDNVFRLLEETLYNGTLEQRQTALRWLDKLFPIKHR